MGKTIHKSGFLVGTIALFLFGHAAARADGDASAPSVTVSYAKGKTELRQLTNDDHFYSNRVSALRDAPEYLIGLQRTCRAAASPADVTIEAAEGATIYLMVDSDSGKNMSIAGVSEMNATLAASGWARLDDVHVGAANSKTILSVYKRTGGLSHLTIGAAGYTGVIVASANLSLAGAAASPKDKANAPGESTVPGVTRSRRVTGRSSSEPKTLSGPAAHITTPQSTIKILSVRVIGGEDKAGDATDFILTVTPGERPAELTVEYVTEVGPQMLGVTDDVLRYMHVKYPNWYAEKAEFTFGDHSSHEGPSIGAAVGTLIRSVIEGFHIDPTAAITGDIAANGAIHAIGGLSYKLHGAAAAGCSIVAVPSQNYENLEDAVIYKGPSIISNVQVIGMIELDDAVAIMRKDRDAKLSQAINQFAIVQEALKADAHAIHTSKVEAQLQDIANLCPRHLSARILLQVAQKKLRRTLTPMASLHYTNVSVDVIMPILVERLKTSGTRQAASPVVQQQLAALEKLRPMADVKVAPLIEAYVHFLRNFSDLESGRGSLSGFEAQWQKIEDERARLNADPDLSQVLYTEGM